MIKYALLVVSLLFVVSLIDGCQKSDTLKEVKRHSLEQQVSYHKAMAELEETMKTTAIRCAANQE